MVSQTPAIGWGPVNVANRNTVGDLVVDSVFVVDVLCDVVDVVVVVVFVVFEIEYFVRFVSTEVDLVTNTICTVCSEILA